MKEEMSGGHKLLKEEMLAKMKANQERIDAKMDAHHERIMGRMDSQLEKMETAVDVFEKGLKKMDTTDLETIHEESEAITEKQGAPKEEAALETIRALEDLYADRYLAAGRS
jgi:hypothetical protein